MKIKSDKKGRYDNWKTNSLKIQFTIFSHNKQNWKYFMAVTVRVWKIQLSVLKLDKAYWIMVCLFLLKPYYRTLRFQSPYRTVQIQCIWKNYVKKLLFYSISHFLISAWALIRVFSQFMNNLKRVNSNCKYPNIYQLCLCCWLSLEWDIYWSEIYLF